MTPQTVRVDNWILVPGEKKGTWEWDHVIETSKERVATKNVYNKTGTRWLWEEVKGIELTQNVLYKLGFKIDLICELYTVNEGVPEKEFKVRYDIIDECYYWEMEEGCVILDTLHQLQNLYLDITGDELKINL